MPVYPYFQLAGGDRRRSRHGARLETGHVTCLWIVDSEEVGPFSCKPKTVVRGTVPHWVKGMGW